MTAPASGGVHAETSLLSLGLDSLAVVRFVSRLQAQFRLALSPGALFSVETFGELDELLFAGDAAACVNMAHVLGQGLVGRCPDARAARRWLDLAARRRGSRRDDARDTAVSSLVAAAPAPQLRSLVPGPAPTSPKDSRVFLPALPV